MNLKVNETLTAIQSELKAPKGQYNSFGKYNYRSCEDILEALKPILAKYGAALTLSDEIMLIGTRFYVKATATLFVGDEKIVNSAFAREEETKKGMDGSQITGTASSYARKYALNGLFCIDDTKDADTDEYKHIETESKDQFDYRKQFIILCKEKNIDSIEYAKNHGINKQTTQEEYKAICKALQNSETAQPEEVTMNEI